MLNDHDGDWPWLSYHALIHHHDVPDGDFLRTCMEEVEHNLAKACPLVTQSVDEYLERVLKVVVFSWTCSLFSVRCAMTYTANSILTPSQVETLRDTDLAHIYNVSPEDMQNLTQALDANRKAIHGAVVLRLVPRIVRYSAEDKAGPSSETAQERDARRLYAQVAAERDARRLYAQVAAKDDIENQPATIASDRKSDSESSLTWGTAYMLTSHKPLTVSLPQHPVKPSNAQGASRALCEHRSRLVPMFSLRPVSCVTLATSSPCH